MLQRSVDRKLMQKCSGARITAVVRSGDATISGAIRHEHERKLIVRCVAGVPGVRRVHDQLRVDVRKNRIVKSGYLKRNKEGPRLTTRSF